MDQALNIPKLINPATQWAMNFLNRSIAQPIEQTGQQVVKGFQESPQQATANNPGVGMTPESLGNALANATPGGDMGALIGHALPLMAGIGAIKTIGKDEPIVNYALDALKNPVTDEALDAASKRQFGLSLRDSAGLKTLQQVTDRNYVNTDTSPLINAAKRQLKDTGEFIPSGLDRTPQPVAQERLYDTHSVDRAIKEYGTTNVPESSSFVTRDGKVIDSSGRLQGAGVDAVGRNIDHREIAVHAIDDAKKYPQGLSGSDALSNFMNDTGVTRVNVTPDEIAIDTLKPLSDSQLSKLSNLAQGKRIEADISRLDGSVIKSGTFNSFGEYKKWIETNLSSLPQQTGGALGGVKK